MAEARQAVSPVPALGLHTYRVDTSYHSFQAAVTHDGLVLYVPHPVFILKNVRRWFYRMRNSLRALLWPSRPFHVVLVNVGLVWYVLRQPANSWFRSGALANVVWAVDSFFPWTKKLSTPVRVTYLAFSVGALACTAALQLNRLFLRSLLHYQQWINESKPSLKTKIWGLLIKALYIRRGEHHLYDFQDSLPRLPVPDLRETCDRYLTSMQPLLSAEDFAETKAAADTFCKKEGRKLQRFLKLKSWVADSYVTDWWLNLVYLRGRSSLLINSNFYGIGLVSKEILPTTNQVARAASMAHRFCRWKQLLEKEQLAPQLLQGVRPICMAQYQNVFSMTRIPGKEMDSLRQWESSESRHIVVLYKGNYYRINMYGSDLKLISAFRLQAILQGIVDDANPRHADDPLGHLAVLTTTDRTTWASVREQHFSDGLNRASLNVIERAMFIVHLDENTPETLTEEGNLLFHGGNGLTRWCDKSFMLVVFANCFTGIHVEHSWADAPVIAHLFESCLAADLSEKDIYHPDTGCIMPRNAEEATGVFTHSSSVANLLSGLASQKGKTKVKAAERLDWVLSDLLADAVHEARVQVDRAISDIHLVVRCFDTYGKGDIKKMSVAPDALIQMALQLAFYRDQHEFVQTYESAMTRLFRNGRTETIRSASTQSAAFVLAMEDATTDKDEKIRLLREACKQHVRYSRDAMTGRGVDRHLFALYVVAAGMGVESPFLRKYMSVPWRLSTSQVPQRQTPKGSWPGGDDEGDYYFSASGGFGPVADDGYGVSYAVCGNRRLFFHVSSKHSSTKTDSARFLDNIAASLVDIRALFR